MPIDAHAKRFLDMLAITGARPAAGDEVAQRRTAYQGLMRFSRGAAAPCTVEERVIQGTGGAFALRIYSPPAEPARSLPGLVYFHGGGLVAGSLDDYHGLVSGLAAASFCRIVAVDYRLAPEHPFPAAILDSFAATEWVAEHTAELRIDRARLGVAGDSAGGGLAASVCHMARQASGPHLAVQLLLCPVLDCDMSTPSRRALAQGHLLDEATMRRDLVHYCPQGAARSDARLAPLQAQSFAGLPRAYIHTAEFDPLRDEGEAYAAKLAQAGVDVHYHCHAGMIHHFYGLSDIIPTARPALSLIGAELKAAFSLSRKAGVGA